MTRSKETPRSRAVEICTAELRRHGALDEIGEDMVHALEAAGLRVVDASESQQARAAKARARSMTAQERSDAARRAINARWAKAKRNQGAARKATRRPKST